MTVAVATLLGFAAPTRASTLVTTARTEACGPECEYSDSRALLPFDSSLGTLNAIILQIDAASETTWQAFVIGTDGITPKTGTAEFSYSAIFNALVNGVSYSFGIAGSDSISITQTNPYPPVWGVSTAYGSATFVIDPSLFDTFIDRSTGCGAASEGSGICVSGDTGFFPRVGDVMHDEHDLFISCPCTATSQIANFTLRYVYTPRAIPELTTWVMMLVGFGAIGFALRRQSKESHAVRQTFPYPAGGVYA